MLPAPEFVAPSPHGETPQVADSEAKPESPTVEVLGGHLPPWRKAAPWSSGEEAPAAAEERGETESAASLAFASGRNPGQETRLRNFASARTRPRRV